MHQIRKSLAEIGVGTRPPQVLNASCRIIMIVVVCFGAALSAVEAAALCYVPSGWHLNIEATSVTDADRKRMSDTSGGTDSRSGTVAFADSAFLSYDADTDEYWVLLIPSATLLQIAPPSP